MCVIGILLALLERNRSGKGQVVEADMVSAPRARLRNRYALLDASLHAQVSGTRYIASFPLLSSLPAAQTPYFGRQPGDNVLDGAAPCKRLTDTTADKRILKYRLTILFSLRRVRN